MEAIQAGFRSSLRILIFLCYLVMFLVVAFGIYAVTQNPFLRRRRAAAHATWWARLCAKTFGIQILVKNRPPLDQPALIVGNHLGFIDILANAAIMPNLFVTSQEMRETPVLGLITDLGGCLYVERRDRANIQNELGQMVEYLKNGLRIILYPEATSTNGEGVLPFKRTLLSAAAHAGVPIVPFVFNFREINGEPGFLFKYRDSVCWYGDITFLQAIWRSFGLKHLICEVEFLSPVYAKTDDDRAAVADGVREMIVQKYNPVQL